MNAQVPGLCFSTVFGDDKVFCDSHESRGNWANEMWRSVTEELNLMLVILSVSINSYMWLQHEIAQFWSSGPTQ